MDDQERDENVVEMVDLDQHPVSTSLTWFSKSISKFTAWKQSPRIRTTFFISTFLVCILILALVLGLRLPSLSFFKETSTSSSTSHKPVIPTTSNTISTTIANGFVYVNTPDGTLSARQADTGKVIWHIKLPHNEHGLMQADNYAVYSLFSNHNSSMLEARNTQSGALLWQKQLPLAGPGPLIVDNGILYFDERGGTVYALRTSDGELVWHFASHFSISMDAFLWAEDNITIVRSTDSQVHILHSNDGIQLFSYVTAMASLAPQIDQDILYYQSTPITITALNLNNGRQLWQYTTSEEAFSLWGAQDNQVYLEYNNQQGILTLNGTTGKMLWKYNALLNAAPIIQHGILYASLQGNTIFALRASDGSPLWRQIISPFQYGPIAADDIIYFEQSNSIQALDSNGTIRWIYTTHDGIAEYPQESNGLLLITYHSPNNAFDVLRASDGTVLWQYTS